MSDEALPEPDRIEDAPHPRETSQLFGHDTAEQRFLTAARSGRLHHAWLLTGPLGIGKATLAWRMARHMFAGMPEVQDSLHMSPDDPTFRRVAALSEPGLFLCRRAWDDKAKRLKTAITVDEIRKLGSFFTLSSTDGGWRVAIIDAADEMNLAAANALLKVLEEPPERVLIILVAHRPARLLPTIRSRCRTLRMDPLAHEDLARALQAAGFGQVDTNVLGPLSEGSVGDAIQLMSGDGPQLYADLLTLFASTPRMDRQAILSLADGVVGKTAQARYDLLVRLILLATGRIVRIGAGACAPEIEGEAQAAGALTPTPHAAKQLAEVMQTLTGKAAHARAVHLDPAQVILDMFLSIEASVQRAA